MEYRTRIGLEIHVQLKTKSKMFCGCKNDPEEKKANTAVCPVCMGFPGVLPVANSQAIEWTLKTAMAFNCQIARLSKFDRKHYFYPDLPKNYQISQYDLPLAKGGWLEIELSPAQTRRIRIRRIHLEEDTAKLLHSPKDDYSLIDFNRSGTPLMEIVTEPDITSPGEAKIFLQELRRIFRYLGVSDADMEKGQMRCDANISLSESDSLGVPVEIKNLNSFKMLEKALIYEKNRQQSILAKGKKVTRETRGWVDNLGKTSPQRIKEEASDYRYFPEPDLPPFTFSLTYLEKLKKELPELPFHRKRRFLSDYHLSHKEAAILAENKTLGDYFEKVVAFNVEPKKASSWILVELLGKIDSKDKISLRDKVPPANLASLILMVQKGEISGKLGKEILVKMLKTGLEPVKIIETEGLRLIGDKGQISEIVERVIKENPKAVSDYKKGKMAAVQFLVGQVMRRTGGKVEPKTVKELLEGELKRENGEN